MYIHFEVPSGDHSFLEHVSELTKPGCFKGPSQPDVGRASGLNQEKIKTVSAPKFIPVQKDPGLSMCLIRDDTKTSF